MEALKLMLFLSSLIQVFSFFGLAGAMISNHTATKKLLEEIKNNQKWKNTKHS